MFWSSSQHSSRSSYEVRKYFFRPRFGRLISHIFQIYLFLSRTPHANKIVYIKVTIVCNFLTGNSLHFIVMWNPGSLFSIRISLYGHDWSLMKTQILWSSRPRVTLQPNNEFNTSFQTPISYTGVSSFLYHSMTIRIVKQWRLTQDLPRILPTSMKSSTATISSFSAKPLHMRQLQSNGVPAL